MEPGSKEANFMYQMHEQTKRIDSNTILYDIKWTVDANNIRNVAES